MSRARAARLLAPPRLLVVASLVTLALSAGCGGTTIRPCKEGTLFVTVTFDSTTSAADDVAVAVFINGTPGPTHSVLHADGVRQGTIEIDFPGGYPKDKRVEVTLTATKSGTTLGTGPGMIDMFPAGCGTLTINLMGGGNDGAAGDGGGGRGGMGGLGGSSAAGTTGTAGTTGRGGTGGAAGTTGAAGAAGTTGTAGRGGTTGAAGTTGAGGAAGTTGTAGRGGTGGAAGTTGAAGAAGTTGTAGRGGTGGSSTCTTPPAASPLVGWAAVSGNGVTTTTGGGSTTPLPVSSFTELSAAAAGTTPAVIYVSGVISPGSLSVGSNKTIVGLCGAELHGHVDLKNVNNVIIRNIKIVGYGVGNCASDPNYDSSVGCSSGNDAVTVYGSHHVWFDHDDISDGTDGNLDTTNGSDNVTISWTKFHYTPRMDLAGSDSTGAAGHRYSNLVGSTDGLAADIGHLNVTFSHDWWADNVNQRMPRTRTGKIHVLNCLYTSVGNAVCTNAGNMAHVQVEGTVYSGVTMPLQIDASGDMKAINNIFTNTTGTTTASGTGFVPPYVYTVDDAATVQAAVMAGAGPQ